MKTISFPYRNHRGEIRERTIVPDALEFITSVNPNWNNQPGWFISGHEEGVGRRSFALSQIVIDTTNVVTPHFFTLNLKDQS